jgi:hypothetical protein
MSRSVVELAAQPRKLMTNSVISKMTAIKEMIARHIPVAQVLRRALSTLSENIVRASLNVNSAYLSSKEGKSSSPSTTHALTIAKKARTYKDCQIIHCKNKSSVDACKHYLLC